jgi:hypothetical protein
MKERTKRQKRGSSVRPDEARWTGALLPSPSGTHVELICEYLERPDLPKVHVSVSHEDVAQLIDSLRGAMGPPPDLNS